MTGEEETKYWYTDLCGICDFSLILAVFSTNRVLLSETAVEWRHEQANQSALVCEHHPDWLYHAADLYD